MTEILHVDYMSTEESAEELMEEDKHTEERFMVLSTRRNASRSSAHGGTLHGPQHTRNASRSSAHGGTLHGPQHTEERFTVLSTRRNASWSSAHGGTLHGPHCAHCTLEEWESI
eukprot:Em0015g221a